MGRPRSNNKWSIDNNIALTILKHGGTCVDIKTAAEVYNKKAKEIFGEFARLNKIGDKDENLHTNE